MQGRNPIIAGVRGVSRASYWPQETLRLQGWLLSPVAVREIVLLHEGQAVARAGQPTAAPDVEQRHPGIEAAGSRFAIDLELAGFEGRDLRLEVEIRGAFGHRRSFGPFIVTVLGPHSRLPGRVRWLYESVGRRVAFRAPASLPPAATKPVGLGSGAGLAAGDAAADGARFSICIVAARAARAGWRRTFESLVAQRHGAWEATVLFEASAPAPRDQAGEDADGRLALGVYESGQLTLALGRWAATARGTLLAVLEAGDELDPLALRLVARAQAAHPAVDWLYTDEDRVGPDGGLGDAHFKPGWSPERLLCQFYLGQLSVFSKRCVERTGGFPAAPDGQAMHVLALSLDLTERNVVHLPEVLCHRPQALRPADRQPAEPSPELSRAFAACGRRAVLRSAGEAGMFTPEFELPDPPEVAIFIPSRNSAALLENCVRSVLERTDYPTYRVVVIDNDSTDRRALALLDELAAHPRVALFRYAESFNFARMNNAAIAGHSAAAVLLLNDDTEVIASGWLRSMVGWLGVPGVGAVGAKLRYSDDTLQHAGIALAHRAGRPGHVHRFLSADDRGHHGDLATARNVSAVTGACLLTTRELYLRVGGMDADLPVAYNDVDLCLRIRATGARIVWDPQADLYHFEGQTRTDVALDGPRFERELRYLERRWGALFLDEPYFSGSIPASDEG